MLTTIDNIKAIRDISNNLKDRRITPYIKEIEDAYILPAIGADLYERLDTRKEIDPILLDGGYYTRIGRCGEERDKCYGLRIAVAYFAYARVLKNNQINVTAFGVTEKHTSLSNPSNDNDVQDAVAEARKMGDYYLQSCVRYLKRDACKCEQKPSTGAKLKMEVIL